MPSSRAVATTPLPAGALAEADGGDVDAVLERAPRGDPAVELTIDVLRLPQLAADLERSAATSSSRVDGVATPAANAAAKITGLNALPGWRRASSTRSNWLSW